MLAPGFVHPNPDTFFSIHRQYFAIPFGIISYITQNPCSAKGFSKLQKSCKYFFAKNKIVVVDINTWIEYKNDHLSYNMLKLSHLPIHKLYFKYFKYWLVNWFQVASEYSLKISKNIYRCNIDRLVLHEQNLTLVEMDFLLNGGKIVLLHLGRVNIRDENGILVTCDKILSKLPNLNHFIYYCENEIFNTEIFTNMNDLKFKSKFQYFSLCIDKLEAANTDFIYLWNFVEKNFVDCQNSSVSFVFGMENAENYKIIQQAAIETKFKEWKQKPTIFVYDD